MKWFDTDTFREILDSITRNRSRSILTGFGIFWGIFMLMLLSGGSQGLEDILMNNFQGVAPNSCIAFASYTSMPYKGFDKGRDWDMDYTDVERLKNLMPELEVVTPNISFWNKKATRGEQSFQAFLQCVKAEEAQVFPPKIVYGRYVNEADIVQERKVCVIGRRVYNTLFPEGGDPCGQRILVDGISYVVIGVDYRDQGVMGDPSEDITIPITHAAKVYNCGNFVQMLEFKAKPGYAMSDLTPRVREILARAHSFDPSDEQAVMMFNMQMVYSIVENLLRGVRFLVWLIGLGTLLAGVIGVSNIMMVSVKERTTEIGIRRAIGATPRQILGQIISESIVLTLVAGGIGISLSVLILRGADLLLAQTGTEASFQITFNTAVLAALLLAVFGVLAGLMPASRAMQIKPVDAMRDE